MSNEIKVSKLKYPDTIIQNIGMYLGETKTFTTPVREIVNNCTDELLNGYATYIHIHAGIKVKLIVDDGRGLPYYIDPDDNSKVITEALLTDSHVGSKFANVDEKTGGLHGIGSKAVNAVSDFYQVFVNCSKKDNSNTLPELQEKIKSKSNPVFTIRYENGILKTVDIIEYDEAEMIINKNLFTSLLNYPFLPKDFSTAVIFTPNLDIYESDKSVVSKLPLKLVKLEAKGKTSITVNGEEVTEFDFNELFSKESLFDSQSFSFDCNVKEFNTSFKVFFGYNKDAGMDYQHTSLVNLIETPQGGYIEDCVWRSLGNGLKHVNPIHSQSDGKLGLRLFVSSFTGLKMSFSSQTKDKLVKLSLKGDKKQLQIDKHRFTDELTKQVIAVIDDNKDYFNSVSTRIIEYKRSLDKLSNKNFILSHVNYANSKDPIKSLGLGSRVYDCTSKNLEDRELYICEGKSAGSSLVDGRGTTEFVAVLPLKGVPLNAATSSLNSIIQNDEFKALINVLGTGVDPIVKMDLRRYSRVYICADSDAAGAFITALLLGFFGKFLLPWIEQGRLYVVKSPLYEQDKKFYYKRSELNTRKEFTRFKGLGKLNPDQASEVLIKDRNVIQVTPVDIQKALELIINEDNQRKALSIELGILVDNDQFVQSIHESRDEIVGSIINSDEASDNTEEEVGESNE